jgi:hypothetical protein
VIPLVEKVLNIVFEYPFQHSPAILCHIALADVTVPAEAMLDVGRSPISTDVEQAAAFN